MIWHDETDYDGTRYELYLYVVIGNNEFVFFKKKYIYML